MSRSITASAPAKTNLALHVGAPGADGYHPLETLFAAVDVRETVTATLSSETAEGDACPVKGTRSPEAAHAPGTATITVAVSPALRSEYERMIEAGTARLEDVPTDDSNLAARAARAVCAAHGCPSDIASRLALHILKAVPVAGGMGGGSADAAAALVAVDELLAQHLGTEPLGREHLLELGAGLGADVPFLLLGGLAVGRGTGTVLESVSTTGILHLVFVPQDRGLSTPAVYRTWDSHHITGQGSMDSEPPRSGPLNPALVNAAAMGDARGLAPLIRNDLQTPALELLPELAKVLSDGAELGALAGWVSGSGPTICFLAEDAAHVQQLLTGLRPNRPHAFATTAPARGAHVVRS